MSRRFRRSVGWSAVVCALGLLVCGGSAVAQDCVGYEGHLAWVGGVDTPGTANWVTVAANHAYVADGTAGVQIFDVTAPATPVLIRTVDTPGTATMLVVQGDYVYVADGNGGLQVIDASVPASASIVASLAATRAVSVAINGALLALGRTYDGYSLVDVSNPSAPSLIGTFTGEAGDVAFAGGYLYIAAGLTGLEVMDISVPTSPTLVTIAAPGSTDFYSFSQGDNAITVSGNVGCLRVDESYMVDERLGIWSYSKTIKMLDLSNPAAPVVRGVLGNATNHARSTIDGSLVYTAYQSDTMGWLEIHDVTNLAAPVRVGRLTGIGKSARVEVADGFAYVAETGMGLQVYDVAPPSSPAAVSDSRYFAGRALTVGGDFAYTIEYQPPPPHPGDDYIWVFWTDLRTPGGDNWTLLGEMDVGGGFYGNIQAQGSYVFVTSGRGLQVIDMSDPHVPRVSGPFVFGTGTGGHILVAGDRAYLTNGNALHVLDISTPTAPVQIATVPQEDGLLTAGAGHLYVTTGSQLYIFDLTNPDAPQLARTLPFASRAIAIAGPLMVAGFQNTLRVYDLSDPSLPAQIGSLALRFALNPSGRGINDVELSGDVAYLAVTNGGLTVVDLSDPAQPRLIGESDLQSATELARYGDRLVAGDGTSIYQMRLHCTDLVPVYLSEFSAEREGAGVRLSWHVAGGGMPGDFRVVGRAGTTTWDVSCAADRSGGFVAFDGSANAMQAGAIAYELWHRDQAGAWSQIGSTACAGAVVPARTCLRGVQPNPFNPATTVTFAVDRPQDVRLSIYDLKGREVAVLAQGRWPEGEHTARWDGTDARGWPQPSGVYLVELRGQTTREARKIVLSR